MQVVPACVQSFRCAAALVMTAPLARRDNVTNGDSQVVGVLDSDWPLTAFGCDWRGPTHSPLSGKLLALRRHILLFVRPVA
jgi:hypothetical protein